MDLKLEDLSPEDRKALPHNHPLLDEYAERMAAKYGVDPALVLGIKNVGERSESNSVSSKKARGVMQTIPATAKALGIVDQTDPVQSIEGGVKLISQHSKQLGTSDPAVLAAAYHAGPGSKAVKSGDFSGMPKTEAYSQRVADYVKANPKTVPAQPAAEPSETPSDKPGMTKLPAGITIDDLNPDDKIAYMKSFYKANPGTSPTSGNSFGENALIGAGKFFSDTGSGLRQVAANVVNPVTHAFGGKDLLPQDYEGEKERRVQDDALMRTWGGNMGYMGAAATSLALPGAGVAKGVGSVVNPIARLLTNPVARAAVAKYGTIAGAAGALSTLTPTTRPGERTENAAVGAALGPVADVALSGGANLARRGINWVGDHVNLGPLLRPSFNAQATPEARQAVARAAMNDVPVYPQQLDAPGTQLSAGQTADQTSRLTRAMNATHGSESDNIPGALNDTRDRLSDVYQQIFGNRTIPLNTPSGPAPANGLPPPGGTQSPSMLAQRLMQIRAQYLQAKPMSTPDQGLLQDIDSALAHINNGGTLSGRQYQNYLRDYNSSAARAARSSIQNNVMTGSADHEASAAYGQMRDALMDHASQYIPQWHQDAFRTANRQWRNMATLQKLAPADINADFNPTTVARALQRTPGGTYDATDPTLQDLARFGTSFMGLDANQGKKGIFDILKSGAKKAAPFIATGLGEGALIASSTTHEDDESPWVKVLKASLLPAGYMAAAAAGRGSLNKPVTLNQLNEPRGALADLSRILQLAPAVEGATAAHSKMNDDGEELDDDGYVKGYNPKDSGAPRIEVHGIGNRGDGQ
jgi:hypothetical protein